MPGRSISYARIDPAHLFDGLFVPTNGRPRGRLYVPPRDFGEAQISFQGYEQLGSDDQSILLAISAQLGVDGLILDGVAPEQRVSRALRENMDLRPDTGGHVASRQTSLRSLLQAAGYASDSGAELDAVKRVLNRLANAQVREINRKTKWDWRANLISAVFSHDAASGTVYVAANPRLTSAIFGEGQYVRISLQERRTLASEAAKLLHAWLSATLREGHHLAAGQGVSLDALGPHVWGPAHVEGSRKVRSIRRGLLREALAEIGELPIWRVDATASEVAVSRLKALPSA